MLADEDPDIRQYAVTHVLKARQTVTSGQSGSSTTDQTQSRSSKEQTQSEENLEDVEFEGNSDDEASGDEAEDEEYPQDKSVRPFKVPIHPKVSGKYIY